jgi:hypothetical protein
MNPRTLCRLLADKYSAEISQVLGLSSEDDTFEELQAALSPQWLSQNVGELISILANVSSVKQASLVNTLEANAFLANFQRAYESGRCNRVSKWASIFSSKQKAIGESGALVAILPEIGTRANAEFLDNPGSPVGDRRLKV